MGSSCGRSAMALVLVLLLVGVGVNAQNCGCATGLCCSQYGFCGTTSDYCGQGCRSGPCSNSGGGSPSTSGGNVGSIISQSFFDGLTGGAASSCEGKRFYTYDAFIAAANAYSGFGTTGSDDVQKRELAAFFANVMHETGGLCSINEINPPQIYCDPTYTSWPCTSGKSYTGRGPLQNYNYGAAGQDIGFDGLNNPEIVAQDATISFKTAVWFWMKNSQCHSAITSGQGFGATIKAINSGECNTENADAVSKRDSRIQYYNNICSQLNVDPGPMSHVKSLLSSLLFLAAKYINKMSMT